MKILPLVRYKFFLPEAGCSHPYTSVTKKYKLVPAKSGK